MRAGRSSCCRARHEEEFAVEPAKIQLRHGRHLTLDDAALLLGVTEATMKQYIAHGTIGRVRIGRRAFVALVEVERLLDLRRSGRLKTPKRQLGPREADPKPSQG